MRNEEEMKEMIQREFRSIKNLEERVVFKELMEQGYSAFASIRTNRRIFCWA